MFVVLEPDPPPSYKASCSRQQCPDALLGVQMKTLKLLTLLRLQTCTGNWTVGGNC
jgi:hypothetical protein